MLHNCNNICEQNAHEIARTVEEKLVKYKRFHAPPPRPEELLEGMRESVEWVDDKVTANAALQDMSKKAETASIGTMFHQVLEGSRDKMIGLLGSNIPNWLKTVPVCYSYTGEPNACVINGPNNHPIIVIDYAFMVGLERMTKLFVLSFDIILPYLSRTPNLKGLTNDEDVWALLQMMELSRREFWESNIYDPPIQVKVSGQDRLQTSFLLLFMVDFIIAHELSHIILGHLDVSSTYSPNKLNRDTKFYSKSRSQEREADINAIELHKSNFRKHPGIPDFVTAPAPLMLMKYFEFLERESSSYSDTYQLRSHPHPRERYEYLNTYMPELSPDANRYLEHFGFLMDFGKKIFEDRFTESYSDNLTGNRAIKESSERTIGLLQFLVKPENMWLSQFFEGPAPSLDRCQELIALVEQDEEIEEFCSKLGLTLIEVAQGTQVYIEWARVIGDNPPANIVNQIDDFREYGIDVLTAGRQEQEVDSIPTHSGKGSSARTSAFYEHLISRFPQELVHGTLAIFYKRQGGREHQFDPVVYCRILEEAGTPENRTQVEAVINQFNQLPGSLSEKVHALNRTLDIAEAREGTEGGRPKATGGSLNRKSAAWLAMGLPPEFEQVMEAYFEAILESCKESAKVIAIEYGLFVCCHVDYLLTIPTFNIRRKEPLPTVTDFHEFLEIHKSLVDKHARDEGLPPPEKDEYWDILAGQVTSMIKESGATHRIMEIDKRFGLYEP